MFNYIIELFNLMESDVYM